MGSELKHEPESDADSMAEYGDGDTGKHKVLHNQLTNILSFVHDVKSV